MENDAWRARLSAAIDKSGMSNRAVSLQSGRGPGYIHGLMTEGKSPTIENLIEVCKVVGASPSFILYGVDIQPEDAEIISAMHDNPDTRDAALTLLRNRKAS